MQLRGGWRKKYTIRMMGTAFNLSQERVEMVFRGLPTHLRPHFAHNRAALTSLHSRGILEADSCINRQIAKVHHIAKGGSALKGRWVLLV
jgi:hypothetical protein